jgi:hypothetical protein
MQMKSWNTLFCGEKLQAHRGEGTSMNALAWKISSTM